MSRNKYDRIAETAFKSIQEERLRVSFDYLDWHTEEFFFHGMELKYYQKFFACITELTRCKESDITEQTHPSLSPKSIFNSNSSIKTSFPESVIIKLKDQLYIETRNQDSLDRAYEIASRAFEISLSKNYGRIHGFVWNNTFHLVWFDPAHNLYPMKRGITRHKDAATVRCFAPEEVKRLQAVIRDLQVEIADLYEALM
ncbi:MAG: hypothetical protein ACO34J_05120 [Prochlorothrix sp.]